MKLIVGLGNIGAQYAKTRHNIGFMIVDQLAVNLGGTWKTESKLKAEIAALEVDGEKVILAKPNTMMNLSGDAIGRIARFYKIDASDVWVVFDDLDVPFGRLRVRSSGSSGGHQGAASTIQHVGPDFVRVRVGISMNDRAVEPSESYVLKTFDPDERDQLVALIESSVNVLKRQLTLARPEETTFYLV